MTLAIGCVAEPTPKYLRQAERLVKSWRWFAGRYAREDFHVCVVGDATPEVHARFAALGAHVHAVARFSSAHAQSNKLRFLELDVARAAQRTVLLDCDTIVVQEPRALFEGEALIAKMADDVTVPHAVFERLFAAFGVALPAADRACTVSHRLSIPYFNAGVLSFSAEGMRTLVPRWIELNRQLLARLDLLGDFANFCDQASLALAVAATGARVTYAGDALNFAANFPDLPVSSAFGQTDPVVIHYHWMTDAQGRLLDSPYPNVNRRIASFNHRETEEAQR